MKLSEQEKREHEKFLKRMGVTGNNTLKKRKRYNPPPIAKTKNSEYRSLESDFCPVTKKDEKYKRNVSNQYIVGQSFNKSGFQVLSKKEADDPNTGKRR